MDPRRVKLLKILRILAITAALGGLGALAVHVLGNPPDFELEWRRRVPAEADLRELSHELWKPAHWPRWFFYLDSIENVDAAGEPRPGGLVLEPGARLRLHINPKKGFSRRSHLLVRVLEFDPARGIALRLEFDSSGKLTGLFDQLTWKLELKPGPGGTVSLEGSETARTRARRSRAYGRVAPAVLLNQVYPVDLLGLARITKLAEPPPVRLGF